jgi:hypothetical protein
MTRQQHTDPKSSPIRALAAVVIALALGFVLQWILVTPSPPIEQVQARIQAARSRPAPLLQPLPQVNPAEAREWTMPRDPFAALSTATAPSE